MTKRNVGLWHIATNRRAFNVRSLSGVLRTWMGEAAQPETGTNELKSHAPAAKSY